MPFIACLNNVKTTHATTTHAPATKQTPPTRPPIKETSRHIQHNNAHQQENRCTSISQPENNLVAKMLASTMQISNNNPTNTPHPPTGGHGAKGGPETPTTHAADPSGPNSVLDPTPNQRWAASTRTPTDKLPKRASTIPLVNTTIRARTFAWRRGVCSLERR